MVSPHIIDIRWRIAAEEKASRMPPPQSPFRKWYARRHEGIWGVMQHIPDGRQRARFIPVSQSEFDEVNARYRD